jgi:hypothetical protein
VITEINVACFHLSAIPSSLRCDGDHKNALRLPGQRTIGMVASTHTRGGAHGGTHGK